MKIFEGNNQKTSMMRFGFFYSIIIASILSIYIVIKNQITFESVTLITSWLLTAFGGKGLQSFAEKNNGGSK